MLLQVGGQGHILQQGSSSIRLYWQGAPGVAPTHAAWSRCWRKCRKDEGLCSAPWLQQVCSPITSLSLQGPAVSSTRRQPEQQPQQRRAPAGPPCTGATTQPAAACPRPGVWGLHLRSLQSHSPRTLHWWWLQLTAPPAGSPLQWGSPAVHDLPRGAAQESLAQTHLLCTSLLRMRSRSLLKAAGKHWWWDVRITVPPWNDLRDAEKSSRISGVLTAWRLDTVEFQSRTLMSAVHCKGLRVGFSPSQ